MLDDAPTIVLVHGAFTEASISHGVIAGLQRRGPEMLAPAMPMRSLAGDAAYLRADRVAEIHAADVDPATAGRAGSTVMEIDTAHAAPVAHPAETAQFIAAAAAFSDGQPPLVESGTR